MEERRNVIFKEKEPAKSAMEQDLPILPQILNALAVMGKE